MAGEIDLLGILADAAKSPEGKKDIQGVLNNLDQWEQVLGMVERVLDRVEKWGLIPGITRGLAKRYDVDVETPLASTNAITPVSDIHKSFFAEMNKLPQETVKEIIILLQNTAKQERADKDGPTTPKT